MFYLTGDTHGDFSRFVDKDRPGHDIARKKDSKIIVLGDAGFNFTLGLRDIKTKNAVSEGTKCTFYCLRGNHEARPSTVKGMRKVYDDEVENYVYVEKDYPRIKYLLDYGVYNFGGRKTFVIGGAYSVDKWYRLTNGWTWYENEQLSEQEMIEAQQCAFENGNEFDLILSHTCPDSWSPRDLFLPMVDQSKVDKSMELWLEDFRHELKYKCWVFGHYHDDRFVRPRVEMIYKYTYTIDEMLDTWDLYEKDRSSIIGFRIDPNFYSEAK